MAKADESQYYTVPEAARKLRVSSTTVWRWIQAGKLRAFRVGPKSIRIVKEDLEAVISPVPARPNEVPESPLEEAKRPELVRRRATPEELARRQELVARILENAKKRDISPLASDTLVQETRKEAMKKFGKPR